MSHYRTPSWTKKFSSHRQFGLDSHTSPRQIPTLTSLSTDSLRTDVPRVNPHSARISPGHSPVSSPHISHHESLPDLIAEVRSDATHQYQQNRQHKTVDHAVQHRHSQPWISDRKTTTITTATEELSGSPPTQASQTHEIIRSSSSQPNLHENTASNVPERRHSDTDSSIKFLPGYWWMTLDAAEHDGIVSTSREVASRCRFSNTRVLPLMSGTENIMNDEDGISQYTRYGPWSTMPLSLISAVGSVIMVLRGAELVSHYAPSVGVRFDGYYKVIQYGCNLDSETSQHCCRITLQRVVGQTSIDDLRRIPRQSQVEDWILYDRLEAMSDSSGRSRGDLMHELTLEYSRRSSASSAEITLPSPPCAGAAAPPPPPMPRFFPPAPTTIPPTVPAKDSVRMLPAVIPEDPMEEEFEALNVSQERRGSAMSSSYKLSP
ncbi:hypothetical protein Cpir12675_000718 [Ceratocystis pirilliformis]|uniref:YDG domain-containing protein n=1 Tax=Ceratocystis pirilliformis TaxID=259994 RepID=A0ABR3ZKY8_9PEZI